MSLRQTYRNVSGIVVSLIASVFLLNSCFTKDPAYTRDNIAGYWMLERHNSTEINVSETEIFEFSGNKVYRHRFMPVSGTDVKWSSDELRYSVSCCTVDISGEITGIPGIYEEKVGFELIWDVLAHNDSILLVKIDSYKIDGIDNGSAGDLVRFKKVSPDKSTLVGVWQIESINGNVQEDFRVEFYSDLSYDLLIKNAENQWSVVPENEGEYVLYADFIALTQFGNSYFGNNSQGWSALGFNVNIIEEEPEDGEGKKEFFLELISDNLSMRFSYIKE